MVTITTVGCGDIIPVTAADKVVAAILMVTGIITFATLHAYLSNAIVRAREQRTQSGFVLGDVACGPLKNKIDNIAGLNQREIDSLAAMIKAKVIKE
jgi:tRNA A22 N-methylase